MKPFKFFQKKKRNSPVYGDTIAVVTPSFSDFSMWVLHNFPFERYDTGRMFVFEGITYVNIINITHLRGYFFNHYFTYNTDGMRDYDQIIYEIENICMRRR
jgi:hypothetical protein